MTERQSESDWLAERFEERRSHLRGVAYRMLGNLTEADDAVQETWVRLSRADTSTVQNLGGWLTTLVARVSLDMLRSRTARREESLGTQQPASTARVSSPADPEHEAILADAVGLAVLVVLERLNPAERLAFVLHDMFGVPFDEIAVIIGRSLDATRQLASRARRRVRGADSARTADLARQRPVVDAFLAALRAGDFDALIAVLDPNIVVRSDIGGLPGAQREIHGAREWATGAIKFSRQAESVRPALVDGSVGAVWAPRGRLVRAVKFDIVDERITRMDIMGDRATLDALDLAVLDD
jgi:RNA polymerase sigma factor (sigma-70 family)